VPLSPTVGFLPKTGGGGGRGVDGGGVG
jgi:hypothetical protein